ncbi:hypothetical protein [Cellvibrio mixtus]|uniref:hypothetical protein n=1 Tax=Cellvibrio mixtus TaxID=39650 RepID=UPI00114035DA|nr:hypothetical protein [Cellvibrio mixtus]
MRKNPLQIPIEAKQTKYKNNFTDKYLANKNVTDSNIFVAIGNILNEMGNQQGKQMSNRRQHQKEPQ